MLLTLRIIPYCSKYICFVSYDGISHVALKGDLVPASLISPKSE